MSVKSPIYNVGGHQGHQKVHRGHYKHLGQKYFIFYNFLNQRLLGSVVVDTLKDVGRKNIGKAQFFWKQQKTPKNTSWVP